ncbi:hypothetical protein M201_gp75 [Haloarcula californiae tailed virus 2]|uniref:Uncharacterized protein n=1 Tax=Haloarcula californiae tailed virus 2 TaxID=1273747 RepID=R4TNQ4_9CAUD|nr:hypothetical protein M201_gp75 [Haloarcula californiae tailed virus 2]AGM11863.1 hypothetical protein HCTV2_85 [Haloarcula californiae tailed virus 2]
MTPSTLRGPRNSSIMWDPCVGKHALPHRTAVCSPLISRAARPFLLRRRVRAVRPALLTP